MTKDVRLAVDTAKRNDVRLALGHEGLKAYEEACADPKCKDLDSRVVYRLLGGKEDWRKGFPEEVPMRKEETRKIMQLGREQLKQQQQKS